jgi:hypothetical protein
VRLVHYRETGGPFVVESRSQEVPVILHKLKDPRMAWCFRPRKPRGLWVSDEDDFGWSAWCRSEEFRVHALVHAHLVELAPDANIAMVTNEAELDSFHERYAPVGERRTFLDTATPDWAAVARDYSGMLITPYLWKQRLTSYLWYYAWDCASGCIWDAAAIASVTPLVSLFKPQLTREGR